MAALGMFMSSPLVYLVGVCAVLTLAQYLRRFFVPHKTQDAQGGVVSSRIPSFLDLKVEPLEIDFSSIKPLPDFNVDDTPEIQYRPFKGGIHHLTMGLMKMPEDSWIELDETYREKMAIKRRLVREARDIVLSYTPEGWEPSFEALEVQVDFVTRRFPSMYKKTENGVVNLVLNEDWDIRRESKVWETHHPTEVMGLLTLDDYVIMSKDVDVEPEQQKYRVRAGCVCFPGGWKVRDKVGLSVFELHSTKVPGYEEKIARSMDRFFSRIRVTEPVQRFNYHIDPSPDLYHPTSHHNVEQGPATLEELHFRVERQCLRRLPRTRAVIFQIRTYLYPMLDAVHDHDMALRWRASVDGLLGPIAKYKNKPVWENALVALLDDYIEKHKPLDT